MWVTRMPLAEPCATRGVSDQLKLVALWATRMPLAESCLTRGV
jgi:hypothetical protein